MFDTMTSDFHNGVRMLMTKEQPPSINKKPRNCPTFTTSFITYKNLLQGTIQLNKQYYPLYDVNINISKP